MSATSTRKFVLAVIPTSSVEKRDEFIQLLTKVANDARENECGTLKYAIFLPRDAARETDIWIVEEYANEGAFEHHMSLPVIADMTKWLGDNPGPVAPIVRFLGYPSDTYQLSRAEINKEKDPWVIVAELDYQDGGVGTSMPYWQAVVDESRVNEPGTLVYGILKEETQTEKLLTFEAYQNDTYLKDVHVKSKAIEESIRDTKHLRTGAQWTFLQYKGGYLHK